ncbi:MAG TPA: hypothetical protein VJT67_02520 [Longimicrobiaceae bacterium]|nr:hypothetical protein [Longimicrobiaceae bacterium]
MPATPVYRYLRGYALDPGFSTRLDTVGINEVVYRIPFEPVQPGPMGDYVDVIDFDPASGCWYDPVNLGEEAVASQQGLSPSESVPQFHQQFVYGVAMKTIRHFEQALGRKIIWHPRRNPRGKDHFVRRLRIHPHAIRDANAYYDPEKTALLFGYFDAAGQTLGANYPGGLVFTCLSPDIVAHETTHAILDSIHHRYIEDTNPDVGAFHEGFADIVALLQRFTFTELVEDQLFRASGRMDAYTVLGELATQFGEALEGNRGALRGMIGRKDENGAWQPLVPSPADYAENTEAHDRGAVLVATIFDAFQRIYRFRTADLFRIASGGTGVMPTGSISRDLVGRLAREAGQIAEHLLHICIRALDYCPPVDITFGDYFRALITADLDIAPEDETGYRVALIEAFRARGIFPSQLRTLSVDSLRWDRPDFTDRELDSLRYLTGRLEDYLTRLIDARDRQDVFDQMQDAQRMLHDELMGKAPAYGTDDWAAFLDRLGLTTRPVTELFGEEGKGLRFVDASLRPTRNVPPLEVHTVRPAFRGGREGRQIQQVLITLTQTVRVDVSGGNGAAPEIVYFRGGCSLIISLGTPDIYASPDRPPRPRRPDEREVSVDYVVRKHVGNYRRFRAQADYQMGAGPVQPHLDMYADTRGRRIDFSLLHRH